MDIAQTYVAATEAFRAGDLKAAEGLCCSILERSWEEPETLRMLGELYIRQARYGEAEPVLHRALSLMPRDPAALMQMAVVCGWLGKADEAIAYNELCLRVSPDMAGARWNRSLWLLLHGRYEEGWREYRWGAVTGSRPVRHVEPEWDGAWRDGQTRSLYVWTEQGLGDTLMMLRFLPRLRELAGTSCRIVLEVQGPLLRLIEAQGLPVDRIVAAQPEGAFSEPCGAHISLMSLPRILGVTTENLPKGSYLRTVGGGCGRGHDEALKIGFCWCGNPAHANDRRRSLGDATAVAALAAWEAGLAMTGEAGLVTWRSLVPGRVPGGDVAMDCPPLSDIAGTADVLEELDLVITVDTMLAHLAGAMGKAVWILLPANPDWRWLRGEGEADSRSPWYRSARLYRQERLGDWEPVIERVARDLAMFSSDAMAFGTG